MQNAYVQRDVIMAFLAGDTYICVVRTPADGELFMSSIYPPGEPNRKMEFGNGKDPLAQLTERIGETKWIANAARAE